MRAGHCWNRVARTLAVVAAAIAQASSVHGRPSQAESEVAGASTLRQHAANFTSYTADYAGVFPWFTDPARSVPVCNPAMNVCVDLDYWSAACRWNMPLAAAYYGGNHLDDSFYPPGFIDNVWKGFKPNITPYLYSNTFLTEWRFWDPTQRVLDGSQYRSVAQSDVRSPSEKTLLLASYLDGYEEGAGSWNSNRKVHLMAFVDGHAEAVAVERLALPYRGSSWPVGISWLRFPGMATQMGVRGRDVQ